MVIKCHTCDAEFGIKFDGMTCSYCGHIFCKGHLIENEMLAIDKLSHNNLELKDGICFKCLFNQWGVDEQPTGIFERWVRRPIINKWHYLFNKPNKTELVKVEESSLKEINSRRAWAIFKHQKEITLEKVIQDAREYAKLVAICKGRKNEKDVTLKDVYKFIEWIKNHPNLPNWAHGISWHWIESAPAGIEYIMDAWHVFSAAVATTPPVAIYHVSDRVFEQISGRGAASHIYEKSKDKLGLNFNLKMAVVSYMAGRFILQIYDTETTVD